MKVSLRKSSTTTRAWSWASRNVSLTSGEVVRSSSPARRTQAASRPAAFHVQTNGDSTASLLAAVESRTDEACDTGPPCGSMSKRRKSGHVAQPLQDRPQVMPSDDNDIA